MNQEIPAHLIETLLSLGMESKETITDRSEVIDLLQGFEKHVREYAPESWQILCESLSREDHILLFKGLVYAGILAWGASLAAPANLVFAKLNTRCWPDTVYSLINWADNVCNYHGFATGDYAFAGMLKNR